MRVVGRWCDCLFYENGSRTVRKGPCFSGGVIHRVCENGCPPWCRGVPEVMLQASHTIGIKWPKNSWATMLRGRICVSPIGMQSNALQHAHKAQKEHDATCGCNISCKLLQRDACQGIVYPFAPMVESPHIVHIVGNAAFWRYM